MDKSPCIECEFGNEDKNSRMCVECSARVDYVSGLGGMTHSVPVEKTDLVGVPLVGTRNEMGTHKGMPQRVGTQKRRAAVACRGVALKRSLEPQAKTGENKMTILKEKIEDIIKEVCDEFCVDVARLKAGDCGRGTMYAPARKKIAERLIANYGMSKQKIGELTGVSVSAIFYLLKRKKKTTENKKGFSVASAVDILHKRYIGDDPARKASLQAERNQASPTAMPRQGKIEPKTEDTVTIDFTGHEEILDLLEKYAKEEIRPVEAQALYILQNNLLQKKIERLGCEE